MPGKEVGDVTSIVASPEGQRKTLAEVCKTAEDQAKEHLEIVTSEQEAINATLLDQLESCLPCVGNWPDCKCEGLNPEENNVDPSYRPGTIYVTLTGDEATSAIVTGGATGPIETPEDAEMQAAAMVSKRKAKVMTAYMTEYVEAIQALTRAKSLGDSTGVAEAELAAQQSRQMLNKAKAEAVEAADISTNTYTSDDSVAELDKQYKALTGAIASKARATVSGDLDAQQKAEVDVADLEASINAAKEIAGADGPTAAVAYEPTTTCKVHFGNIEFDDCCGDDAAKTRFLDGCTASLLGLGVRCMNATRGSAIVTLSGNQTAISKVKETPEFPNIVAKDANGTSMTFDTGNATIEGDEDKDDATGPIMDVYEEESSYGNGSMPTAEANETTTAAADNSAGIDPVRFAGVSTSINSGDGIRDIPVESVREMLRRIVESKNVAGAQQALQALDMDMSK